MSTHSSILPRESQGQKSLVGYSPCGCEESDTTELTEPALTTHFGFYKRLFHIFLVVNAKNIL